MSNRSWQSFHNLERPCWIDHARDLFSLTFTSITLVHSLVIIFESHTSFPRDLDRNRIRVIPSLAFDGLGSLQEIFFRHNEVVKLMAGAFYGLSSIHVLDLSWNAIGMVDQPWLYGLENLRELILSHNHINSTNPEGFKFCTFLEKMNLSSNRLETLEADGLSELSNLRYLYIDNNRIANVEDGAFRGLQNLQTLWVDLFVRCRYCYSSNAWSGKKVNRIYQPPKLCQRLWKNCSDLKP